MHIGWRSSFGGRTWVEEQQVGASPSSLCRNSEVFCARFFRIGAPFVASLLSDALCSERSVLAPSSKGAPFVSPFMFAKWERAEKKDHTVSNLKSNKSLGRHCVAPQDACDLKART